MHPAFTLIIHLTKTVKIKTEQHSHLIQDRGGIMSFVLGIDTGGTYTDGVLIDRKRHNIISKAKSLTTREDLSIGITDVIRNMDISGEQDIEFVALSTTLATNAIVEGRGCAVGLIMLGFSEEQDVPAKEIRYLPGGHDIRGNEKCPFDEQAAIEALNSLRGKVDALAVSSYLSIRNPEHELKMQHLARKILDIPVVCTHHLTRSLGMKERSVTALLNACLIPIIAELMQSVKKVMREKKIDAPIMIVKGDGSLMGEAQAMERPIETILSGPAASIIGANFLACERDGMVLDMGGTTTDIAVLRNGVPKLNKEGARVGGWLTRVEAAEINTYGLGGDSYVQKDCHGVFKLGPRRVWPISVMAAKHPNLEEELSHIHLPRTNPLVIAQVTDCYLLLNEHQTVTLDEREKEIVNILRDSPHSIFYIASALNVDVNMLDFEHLVATGVLGQISVTPTDILHAKGVYTQWNTSAAKIAIGLLAKRFDMKDNEFCEFVIDKVTERLAYTTWQSLFNHEGCDFDLEKDRLFEYLTAKQFYPVKDSLLSCSITPTIPIIGIGAPVRIWLPLMADKLKARLVIPEHTEVANAVGAAVGRIMEVVKILITPGNSGLGFVLYSTWERKYFEHLEDAVDYGTSYARNKAVELAQSNTADKDSQSYSDIDVTVEHKDIYADANGLANDIYIETRIEAVATEKSDWL